MMIKRNHIVGSILLASSTLLSACGGGNSDSAAVVNNTSHPIFKSALVKSSVIFKPSGEIKEKNPTFEWKATDGATAYLLGHEDTRYDSRWTQSMISAADANCVIGNVCSYKPQNSQFEVGDEKAWWIKAETPSGWQNWSSAHVFKIIADNHVPSSAKTIEPSGVITTATPTFKWTPGNGASEYQFGMENFDSSNWEVYSVSANQANCSSTECSFKPNNLTFSNGAQKTWWVRENISGTWGNWSKGSAFLVDINTPYVPFKGQSNVSNIVEANGKWYAYSGKDLLQDDGSNNVTTVYTAPISFSGGMSKAIPGKLYFIVSTSRGSTVHGIGHGLGASKALISLTIADNKVTKELTNTTITINRKMKNYLIVSSYHRSSGRQPGITNYYKIDKNSNKMEIGISGSLGRRFSIGTPANNTLIVTQIRGGSRKSSLITDKVGVGLEELTPFKDMPNVSDIVLDDSGSWYAIDAARTKLFKSDGINNSVSVYETEPGFTIKTSSDKNLIATMNYKRLLFIVEKKYQSGQQERISSASLIYFKTSTGVAETIKSFRSTGLVIKKAMGAYAYVTARHLQYISYPSAPSSSLSHIKMDKNGKLIYLGSTGSSLTYKGFDEAKNEIYFTQVTNGKSVNKKITRATNVGLEDI